MQQRCVVIYFDNLTTKEIMNQLVFRPLTTTSLPAGNGLDSIAQLVAVGDVRRTSSFQEAVAAVIDGDSLLLLDGYDTALIMNTREPAARAIEQPPTEVAIRGPHEGFTESLQTNLGLIRKRVKDRSLAVETMRIGWRTRTQIAILYIGDLVQQELVNEVKTRLAQISVDAILESGYIEQYIEDDPFSIFATIGNTELPDVVAAKMLEGRVAIVVDGTPTVLTVPLLFIESFQVPEDYYSRPYYASIVRLVRYIAFAISVLAPAFYVALTSFNQQLIPTPLLITMAAAADGTPFPVLIEALSMGLIFEILREAGVRLPRTVGEAVSIVGTLVIGQAAIQAGIVGAPIIIVVAITALASFLTVPLTDAATILRLFYTLLAGFVGVYGIAIGMLLTLVHLTHLRSFGTPYLSPFAPLSLPDLQDTVVRLPLWSTALRPRLVGKKNLQRKEVSLSHNPKRRNER